MHSLTSIQHLLPLALASDLQAAATSQPANTLSYLRLTPLSPNGVIAELLRKPIPSSDDYCLPGEGAAQLWELLAEGPPRRIARDLAKEVLGGEELAAQLGLPSPLRPFLWRLDSDAAALDLITRLATHPDKDLIVALWPRNCDKPYEVIVPDEAAESPPIGASVHHHRDWFELAAIVKLGGQEEASLAELLAAYQAGRTYVKLASGKWLALTKAFTQRLEAMLGGAEIRQEADGPKIAITAAALPMLGELAASKTLEVANAAASWQVLATAYSQRDAHSPPLPPAWESILRPYQKQGYLWMAKLATWQKGAILADDMGLGKTIQTLAFLSTRQLRGPCLILAPTSVAPNWLAEIKRFTPQLRPHLYRDLRREGKPLALQPGDILIASYGMLQHHFETLAPLSWDILVLDEAQAVKNASTKTTRLVTSLQRQWTLALTGTPIENHLGELWSLFHVVFPELLGSWPQFRERFAQPIEQGKNPEAKAQLKQRIAPFLLRRSKQDHLHELPEKTEIVHTLPLSSEERALYNKVRLEAIAVLKAMEAKESDQKESEPPLPPAPKPTMQALSYLLKLRQICCHPRLVEPDWQGESAKEKHFLAICRELHANGHRALIFSQFSSFLRILRETLQPLAASVFYLDGATPSRERQTLVERFQRGEADFFLISLKAGGSGLNLTSADYVLHMDPWWNPAVEAQASDRAHRMGQKRPVTIYRFITRQSVEEKVLKLHAHKQRLAYDLLGSLDVAKPLSLQGLKELFDA